MQTAMHPHAPRAIKNQNKPEIDSITLEPVHRVIYNQLNYLINLILTHRLNPTLPPHRSDFFLVK
jgi:hypothetical protein